MMGQNSNVSCSQLHSHGSLNIRSAEPGDIYCMKSLLQKHYMLHGRSDINTRLAVHASLNGVSPFHIHTKCNVWLYKGTEQLGMHTRVMSYNARKTRKKAMKGGSYSSRERELLN